MLLRDEDVFEYHEKPRPGKLEVTTSKPCLTQRDLSMAYTPGVARPCLAIEEDPEAAYRYFVGDGIANLQGRRQLLVDGRHRQQPLPLFEAGEQAAEELVHDQVAGATVEKSAGSSGYGRPTESTMPPGHPLSVSGAASISSPMTLSSSIDPLRPMVISVMS